MRSFFSGPLYLKFCGLCVCVCVFSYLFIWTFFLLRYYWIYSLPFPLVFSSFLYYPNPKVNSFSNVPEFSHILLIFQCLFVFPGRYKFLAWSSKPKFLFSTWFILLEGHFKNGFIWFDEFFPLSQQHSILLFFINFLSWIIFLYLELIPQFHSFLVFVLFQHTYYPLFFNSL